jgi:hypothetical protein
MKDCITVIYAHRNFTQFNAKPKRGNMKEYIPASIHVAKINATKSQRFICLTHVTKQAGKSCDKPLSFG